MALLLSYQLNATHVTTLLSWKHPARLRSQEITADGSIILQLSGAKCQLAEDMLRMTMGILGVPSVIYLL